MAKLRFTMDYVAALRKRYSLTSDDAVASMLGVTRPSVCSWRAGRSHMDLAVSRRAATLLDLDPARVAISIEVERARTPEDRAMWEEVLKRLGGVAAGALFAVSMTAAPAPAEAATHASGAYAAGTVAIMSNRRRPGFRGNERAPARFSLDRLAA